jgi:hypothetical protein
LPHWSWYALHVVVVLMTAVVVPMTAVVVLMTAAMAKGFMPHGPYLRVQLLEDL